MTEIINSGYNRCVNNDATEYFKFVYPEYEDVHITVECRSGQYHATLQNNKHFPSVTVKTSKKGKRVNKYHYGYNNSERPFFWITGNRGILNIHTMSLETLNIKNKLRKVFLIFRKQLKENIINIPNFRKIYNIKTKSQSTPLL
jgi:hypothetical protein